MTPERNRNEFQEDHDTDFALELPGQARFRVNLFEDRAGIAAVFRQIPYEIPTFEELGLPEVLRSFAHLSKGLVLVTIFFNVRSRVICTMSSVSARCRACAGVRLSVGPADSG